MWHITSISEDLSACIFRVKCMVLGSGHRCRMGSIKGVSIQFRPVGSGGGWCSFHGHYREMKKH